MWSKVLKITATMLAICITGVIIWLMQTYDYSEKVYSIDKQYSYYIGKYNYNRIINSGVRKAFVYDEAEQRIIHTKRGNVYNWCFGFVFSDDSRIYFDEYDYYQLPRPIDPEAIEEQKRQQKRQQQKDEDIDYKELARQEFYALPAVTPEEIAYIQPVIKRWAAHYEADFSKARVARTDSFYFNCMSDTMGVFFRDFTPEDDSPSRAEMVYSPNKQRYIDIGVPIETIDGKHYETGNYGDGQEVFLVDRKLKNWNLLFTYGLSETVNDAFWKSNDVYITVGIEQDHLPKYLIYVFDTPNKTRKRYEILVEEDKPFYKFGSYHEVFLKKHGILPPRE